MQRSPNARTVPPGKYIDPVAWLRGMIRATIRPRPRIRMWEWIDRHVVIPEEASGPCSGRMRTSRVPIFRGLYDIIQQPHVRYFTFVASARIGKTLLSICVLLYWIAERFGAPGWLDPTRSTAAKLVRNELDEFLLQCKPVHDLAIAPPPHPQARKFWTTFTKSFRGKFLRIIGAGAEAELHGFNLELAINNEVDQQIHTLARGAVSMDKFEARTALFSKTRLILDNSTPGKGGEASPIWQRFLQKTQRYCYLPCPHCSEDEKARMSIFASSNEGKKMDTPPAAQIPGNSARGSADSKAESELSGDARTGARSTPESLSEDRDAARKFGEGVAPAQFVPPSWDEVEPGRSPQSYEPWLRGWQRLTFSVEKKLVPFDASLTSYPKGTAREQWREEITGRFKFSQFAIYEDRPRIDDPTQTEPVKVGYDLEAVENGTTYECAHCQREIDLSRELLWMEERFRWVKHNPYGALARESAHCWSAYNPFQHPGVIAKEFIEAKSDISGLIKFRNLTEGLPWIMMGASIKEDDLDRVIARTPVRYVQGQIPLEAELLTMTIDRQDEQFWWGIRAWGILWDQPERPTWSALIDWGEAVSWAQLLELAGLAQNEAGRLRQFKFVKPDGTSRSYIVTAGVADSGDGDHTKDVYQFCLANRDVFGPYKGGPHTKTLGNPIRIAPIMNKELDLVWAWSDYFASNLYFDCIKNGCTHNGPVLWWLPTNIDANYRQQLTDEYRDDEKKWVARTGKNHLGDVEKMQRVLADKVESTFDILRAERLAEEIAKEEAATAE